MINKKNLWFLTLFSLVLVLSIYYVTMPNEIFDDSLKGETKDNSDNVNIEQSSVIAALKVEDDTNVMEKINSLKEKLTNSEISTEEKNSVFEELKLINTNSSKEETLEVKIKELCNCENFVKIDGDNVRVVLDSDDSSTGTANNIMRLVQSEFDDKMYISVKFN
ncbi:MAG: SpoIIIAH-like family protein [bacterium]|nr:SpoIIIAH-like family protein [bacterium]